MRKINAKRDQKLASLGWRVLRFKEEAIMERIDEVKQIIYANVYEAAQDLKKGHEKKASSINIMYTEIFSEETGSLLGVMIHGV